MSAPSADPKILSLKIASLILRYTHSAPPPLLLHPQAFAEQLSRSVEQRSKEVLEDTLSELSRQPSASIIDLLRSSIEGKQSGSSALQLAMSLRSRLHALTSGSSHLDSPASGSLHTILTLSTE